MRMLIFRSFWRIDLSMFFFLGVVVTEEAGGERKRKKRKEEKVEEVASLGRIGMGFILRIIIINSPEYIERIAFKYRGVTVVLYRGWFYFLL